MVLMITPARIRTPKTVPRELVGSTSRIQAPTSVPGRRPAVIHRKSRTRIEPRSRIAISATIGMERSTIVAGKAAGQRRPRDGTTGEEKKKTNEDWDSGTGTTKG